MVKRKKSELLIELEVLLYFLEDVWLQSKEITVELAVSRSIIKPCTEEVQNTQRYIDHLMERYLLADDDAEEESPLDSMLATKNSYVLIRLAKKILKTAKENCGQQCLILKLDAEEYELLKSRFGSYL